MLSATAAALLLAVSAAAVAWVSWEKRVRNRVERQIAAFESALRFEAKEEGPGTLRGAVDDSIREAALGDARAEIWDARGLVATSDPGLPTLVVRPGGRRLDGWEVRERNLPEGLTLVLGVPDEDRRDVKRVFVFSLLAALPPALLLAAAAGRWAARRATEPLRDLTSRVVSLHDPSAWTGGAPADAPAEIAFLESSFGSLLERIAAALSREAAFATNAAHELRTPITRMRLEAERARAAAEGAARGSLDAILHELDHLARVLDGLLLLAREEGRRADDGTVVNLSDVARDTAARVFGGETARLEAPDETLVPGDERLLAIAIENLLDNARKFSTEAPGPTVTLAEHAGSVVCRVTTPGASLDAEERARAFEPFFRGSRARASSPGSGLGLALASRVAALHGGTLEIASEAGGVVTTLRIPGWRGGAAA